MVVDAIAAPALPKQPSGRGSQAIPVRVYRRQRTSRLRRQRATRVPSRLPLTIAAVALSIALATPFALNKPWEGLATAPAVPIPLIAPTLMSLDALSSVDPIPGLELAVKPTELAHGSAYVGGIGQAALTNIEIAISFLDGTVIAPGERLSFDDTARSWDFAEDPIYVMGVGTTTRGIIPMRGGGVCWVSTALWRAALSAGLRTDFRENHYGLVDQLGAGTDATNTLVIRNDSEAPITVRASLEDERVHVSLLADGPLDRTAEVDGPYRAGRGGYVIYQDVTWADGRKTTSEFVSRYYW